jgi:hypothetical protein
VVPLARQERQVLLANLARQERQVLVVPLARQERQVHLVNLALPEHLDLQDLLEHPLNIPMFISKISSMFLV